MSNSENQPLEAEVDNSSDADSAVGGLSDVYSTESLRSSYCRYVEENGRTYHSMSQGKYILPNDESENDRLDLQHHLFTLTLDGKESLCPIADTAQRVLDIGTGTGIWAIQYADNHPSAHVIGVDLSPIQPNFVPPNCSFETDDIEKAWTWSMPFDFIHSRMMIGSLASWESFTQQSYDALKPGGYLEIQEIVFPIHCDDDTLPHSSALWKWSSMMIAASAKMGRPLDIDASWKDIMIRTGFEDVIQKQYIWPQNRWPKDQKYKELGTWACADIVDGLEGLSMALLTRALGLSKEEVLAFLVDVRRDMRDRKIHSYWSIYAVYGRKPSSKPSVS